METLKPYFTRKDEISIQDGCLLWGSRVIVPSRVRQRVLDELHACHPGMTKMKGLARATLWWPKLDQAIEDKVKSCHKCQVNQNAPAKAPLHPWEWPSMVKDTYRSCGTVSQSTVVDNSGRALKMVGHISSVINKFANND